MFISHRNLFGYMLNKYKINSVSVRQTDSTYGLLQVRSMYKTKDPTCYVKGGSPLLQGGEVRPFYIR